MRSCVFRSNAIRSGWFGSAVTVRYGPVWFAAVRFPMVWQLRSGLVRSVKARLGQVRFGLAW